MLMTQANLLEILFSDEAPAPAAPVRVSPRHFYRCADCLSVVTVDEQIKMYHDGHTMRVGTCGACGGWIEYMGRTERNRLVRTEDQCPCDARCTGARGPSCDCRCGGKNHGSNLWVSVTVDAGGIPVVNTPKYAAEYAKQYRGLVAEVRAAIEERYGAVIARKRAGEYIDNAEYSRYLDGCRLKRAVWTAEAMRSHSARNKKLGELLKAAKGGL